MTGLASLKELLGRRTPGPWERAGAKGYDPDGPGVRAKDAFDWVCTVQVSNTPEWRDNAAAIVALSNAADELVAVAQAGKDVSNDAFAVGPSGTGEVDMRLIYALTSALSALNDVLEGEGT